MDTNALNKTAHEIVERFDLSTLKMIQKFNNIKPIQILPPIPEIRELLDLGQEPEAQYLAKQIKGEVDSLELYGTREDRIDSNWD